MSKQRTLIEAFQYTAEVSADHPALLLDGRSYSYSQILKMAECWAASLLIAAGKTKLKRVVVFASRSLTGYVGVLAAMMTGAAFIPLNPRLPTKRNQKVLQQCQPDAIIVDNSAINELTKLAGLTDLPDCILFPEQSKPTQISCVECLTFVTDVVWPSSNPEMDAYILFTSGSTGEPKGVPIKHKNVCAFLEYCQDRYQVTPYDRLSQTFDQTFDLSIFDLFMAWNHGAAVVSMRAIDLLAPVKYINDNQITIWFSVPSVVAIMQKQGILNPGEFPSLRLSLFCGEPLSLSQIEAWAKAAPNSICENLYGPTELTIACSVYRYQRSAINHSHNNILAIGEIYPHLDYVLLNEDGSLSTTDGELCVRGSQCFAGYLNDAIATNKAFITLKNGVVYYKTGDRVSLDVSGNLLYLGRNDQQVKINGYRVELGEVEATLARLPQVEQAVVVYMHMQKQLSAFIVGDTTTREVKEFVARNLPSYMMPRHINIEKAFPLNANGKIDRKVLQKRFQASICA